MTILTRFVTCLALAAPLVHPQSEPQTGSISVNLHFARKHGCGISRGIIPLGRSDQDPDTKLKVSAFEIDESQGLPAVANQLFLSSPRVRLGPFPCDSDTRSNIWCSISNPPSLDWKIQAQRDFLLDAGSGLAEMQLELDNGAVCTYGISPEDSMDLRLEATFYIPGPSVGNQPNPGRLRVQYVPNGCEQQIVAKWQSTANRSVTLVPLELHLEINRNSCIYRRPPSDPTSGKLDVVQSTPNPPPATHLHGFGTIKLEKALFSQPAAPDGSTPPPFESVRRTR
jgi:hypothetical protein